MTFRIQSKANLEFAQSLEYYLDQETSATAIRFAEAVDRCYDEIIEAPNRFTADEDGVRRKPVPGFPEHSIAYRIKNDTITIISIRHHKRRPGYWKNRL